MRETPLAMRGFAFLGLVASRFRRLFYAQTLRGFARVRVQTVTERFVRAVHEMRVEAVDHPLAERLPRFQRHP